MPRKRKRQFIRTLSKYGFESHIFFDPNPDECTFHAEFMGESYSERSVDALEYAVTNAMKNAVNTQWIPVITVTNLEPFMPNVPPEGEIPFIGFTYDRSYLVIRQDGNVYSCHWDIGVSKSQEDTYSSTSGLTLVFSIRDIDTFTLPYTPTQRTMYTQNVYLAYSENVWNGLQYIQQSIISVKSRLSNLLRTQEGYQRIQEIGQDIHLILPTQNGEHL